MIDFNIRGMEEVQSFVKEFGDKGKKIINDQLYRITIRLRNDIRKSMHSTHRYPGRYYRVGKRRFHKPSAPGFPPAINTGNLVNRMYIDFADGYSKLFFSNVKYAKWLEEGTKRMKARPFLKPGIDRSNWAQSIRNRLIAERFAGRRIG